MLGVMLLLYRYVAPGSGSIRGLVMDCCKEQGLSYTHAAPSQSVCRREREGKEEHPESSVGHTGLFRVMKI